jgi:REP element-mobilizing transposase RayT
LPAFDYAQPGAYYVTIVTRDRENLFGNVENGEMLPSVAGHIAETCWQAIPQHFPHAELGAYVVMPNHVHGILILHDRASMTSTPVGATQWVSPTPVAHEGPPSGPRRGSIGAIIGAYKMAVTRQIVKRSGEARKIWQRNYYEHIIRDQRDHQNVYDYIVANPLNWETDEERPR